jgi:hypothetical protein
MGSYTTWRTGVSGLYQHGLVLTLNSDPQPEDLIHQSTADLAVTLAHYLEMLGDPDRGGRQADGRKAGALWRELSGRGVTLH